MGVVMDVVVRVFIRTPMIASTRWTRPHEDARRSPAARTGSDRLGGTLRRAGTPLASGDRRRDAQRGRTNGVRHGGDPSPLPTCRANGFREPRPRRWLDDYRCWIAPTGQATGGGIPRFDRT